MNKRILLLAMVALVLSWLAAGAIPALRQWRTITQPDGTTLDVMLVGDENVHYYITRDNVPLVTSDGLTYTYARVSGGRLHDSGVLAHELPTRSHDELAHVASRELMKSVAAPRSTRSRVSRRVGQPAGNFTGSRRAIVILAAFLGKPFSTADASTLEFYSNMLNQDGFNVDGAAGSVHNYFSDMSRGVFDLQFDVYGPVRVSNSATYYGGQSPLYGGFDHAGEFITEAIEKADADYDIDWTIYDWDGDGEVEQVFVLYSGFGRATGGPIGTIWPHAWTLDDAFEGETGGNGGISKDGVYINRYACGNELYGSSGSTRMGMGVFCHEFSHCMGLPDMYDTGYGGNYGMDDWDLLDHGSYNGPNGRGECPAAWTSYERHFAGWLDYTVLKPGDVISGMKPITDPDGAAYIIYNDAHPDEYFLLENRQKQSWDKYVPDRGLLIIHVDYDPLLWENNVVNTTGTFNKSDGYTANFTNDHPRMTPIHKLRSIANDTYYDTYPIISSKLNIDSLTDRSTPAATLYNANVDGTYLMHKPITHISLDDNGEISFVFMEGAQAGIVGDVNCDGTVDVDDVDAVIAIILGKSTPDQYGGNADIDGTGAVDVDDVNELIMIILSEK